MQQTYVDQKMTRLQAVISHFNFKFLLENILY